MLPSIRSYFSNPLWSVCYDPLAPIQSFYLIQSTHIWSLWYDMIQSDTIRSNIINSLWSTHSSLILSSLLWSLQSNQIFLIALPWSSLSIMLPRTSIFLKLTLLLGHISLYSSVYYKIEVINNINIYFSITITLRMSLAAIAGQFWHP